MEKWFLKKRNFWPEELQKEFDIPLFLAEILARRDLKSKEEIKNYLKRSRSSEHSPFLFKDMDKAVDLLLEKKQKGEKFLLSLDYDVDGIISGAVSYLGLQKLGFDCECIFPHRVSDGYGINNRIVQYAIDNNFATIVTFDNGIAAFDAIDFAKENGIDVIVTDHHEVPQILLNEKEEDELVDALAIINPHQKLCDYPYPDICGAAIAYKLVLAINLAMGYEENHLSDIYPLVAIATICDVMNLVDENRIFVHYGLNALQDIHNTGLKALMQALGIERTPTVYDIGFRIGPCFNSSGRLRSAEKAFELLIETDSGKATALAEELITLNRERKQLTIDATQKAIQIVEEQQLFKNNIILLKLEDVHESLVGIIAGRLKDRYQVPVIVFAVSEDFYKGSARSVEEVNIFEVLSSFKKYFLKFGGHAMAAGLSVSMENFDAFEKEIIERMNALELSHEHTFLIDNVASFDILSLELFRACNLFEPMGKGNPELLFSSKDVKIKNMTLLGEKKNVLRLDFISNQIVKSFVSFSPEKILEKIKNKLDLSPERDIIGMPANELQSISFDILFKMGINHFKGNEYLNLELISIR